MRRSTLLAGIIALMVGAGLLAGTAFFLHRSEATRTAQPSSVGGPFTLVDQDGQTITEKTFAGKPLLVFFGFTHCPDVCPTTLFEISEALNRLGPDAQKMAALFVSVDPDRDKPETLKTYLSNFNPAIRGATGSETQLKDMARAYRAYFARGKEEAGEYSMDHTAVVYLMDANGQFVAPLNTKRAPEAVAAELKPYLG
jgi:protein SCO1